MKASKIPILFLLISVMSIIGFAASFSVSLPPKLGSGSANVEAPPGISVTSVTWTLVSHDPSLVNKIKVTVSKSMTGKLNIYFIVKDESGVVLQVFQDTLPDKTGTFTYNLDLKPNQPASSIGSIAVTVMPP
jgi:hypothetical protein